MSPRGRVAVAAPGFAWETKGAGARDRGDELAASVVVALVAAAPMAFARNAIDGFEQVKLGLVLTAVLVMVALDPRLFDPRGEGRRGRVSRGSAVALLYLAAAALATVLSTSVVTSLAGADESHSGLAAVAAPVALFFAVRRLGRGGRRRAALLTAATTGATAAAAYAAVQGLGRDPLTWVRRAEFGGWVRPFGTMGHPNLLGGLLAVMLPLQVWLVHAALARRRPLPVAAAGLGVALSGAVLVATFSRGAWAAAVAGLFVSILLLLPPRARRWLLTGGAACLGAALWVLVLRTPAAAGAPSGSALAERVRGLVTLGPRLEIWRAAGGVFLDHPVLGSGLDTFALAFPGHRPPLYWTREYDATPTKAHNEILHALATEGVVGGVAWCLVVAGAIGLGLRAVRRARGPTRGLSAALLGGWVAFLVQAQVGFAGVVVTSLLAVWAALLDGVANPGDALAPALTATGSDPRWIATLAATGAFAVGWLSEPALGLHLGTGVPVLAAVGAVAASQAWAAASILGETGEAEASAGEGRAPGLEPEPSDERGWIRPASRALVAVAAWTLLVLCPFAASVTARSAEQAPPRQAVDLLALAHRLDPLRVRYLRELGLAMLEVEPAASEGEPRTAWLERSRQTLARATRLVPVDAYGWTSLAVAETRLAAAGRLDPDLPFRSLDEAVRLDPANVTFRLAAANAALELGDLARARRDARAAAAMLPDFGPARAQLAHVAAREGRLDEAIRLLREALASRWYGQSAARHVAQANLASLLLRGDLLPEAEAVARALVGEAPSFAPGRYQLGRALEARGFPREAIREYDATLRLAPSHGAARAARRRLLEARSAVEPR